MQITKTVPTIDQIMSVYSGKKNHCCCGCAGKHTTASAHRELRSARRGYAITDDEVSDRSVKTIYNKVLAAINTNEPSVKFDGDYISYENDTRLYILYIAK